MEIKSFIKRNTFAIANAAVPISVSILFAKFFGLTFETLVDEFRFYSFGYGMAWFGVVVARLTAKGGEKK